MSVTGMKKEKNKPKSQTPAPSGNPMASWRYIAAIVIALLTFITYSPTYDAGFVRLDDQLYVHKNESIRELNAENIKKYFTASAGATDMYTPLVYVTYAMEYASSGNNPATYHRDNVLLHVTNALLLFWLVWLLTANLTITTFIAGAFALHPFHVESVAWVSERKDVLYAAFFLGALITYHQYRTAGRKNKYWLSLILFILSCLSKSMAITLPAVLLLYDYFYEKRRDITAMLMEKIPFFLVSMAFALVAIKLMDVSYDRSFLTGYNIFDRIVLALYGVSFYIQKTLLPTGLSAMYTYPAKAGALLPVQYLLGACVTMLAVWLFLFSRYTNHIVRGCFLFYLITIAPVLQLVPNTATITADRYSYIPACGIIGIIAWYAISYARRIRADIKRELATTAAILLALSVTAYARTTVWKDSIVFYNDIIGKGYYRDFAFTELGDAYDEIGDHITATAIFKRGDSLYKDNVAIKARYAAALAADKKYDQAIQYYRRCLELDSTAEGVYVNLGDALLKTDKTREAIEVLTTGYRMYPQNYTCLYNLAYAYWKLGDNASAITYFSIAARAGFQPAIDFAQRHALPLR